MTFEEYFVNSHHNPLHYAEVSVAFKAGAASRDAEIAELVAALRETTVALEHRWEVIANRAAPVMEAVIDAAHTKGIETLAKVSKP